MKRTIAILSVLILGISLLAGCSGGNNSGTPSNTTTSPAPETSNDLSGPETEAPASDSGGSADNDGSSYGIDLASTEVQQMSEKRATQDKLEEAVREWLEGATMFPDNTAMSKRTYQDFVDFIGCDATEYKFDGSYSARNYTWIAEGEDNSKLSVWFKETIGGTWCLSFTGSTNL